MAQQNFSTPKNLDLYRFQTSSFVAYLLQTCKNYIQNFEKHL